nr:DNA primase [uncultured phage]CAI9752278.1 DNA primase [uncultured phage]
MSQAIEKEAITKFGTQYTKYKETEWLFPCPGCKKVNRENLHVNTKNGCYHCFHCDYKGKLRGTPRLSDLLGNGEHNNRQQYKKDTTTYLLPFYQLPLTEEQKQALYKRGLTDDDIKYYHIAGGKRIQIPNYVKGSFSDLICAWEWRKENVTKYNPKYLYTEGVQKSNVLFNIQNITEGSDITLCEGIFNAITAGRTAVASYGCNLSDNQLQLILDKRPKSIIIAYDSDLPGVSGAVKVIEKLCKKNFQGKVYYILLPKGVDINDLGKEKYQEYLKENKVVLDITSPLATSLPRLMFNNI